jgi:hypothetical protein
MLADLGVNWLGCLAELGVAGAMLAVPSVVRAVE